VLNSWSSIKDCFDGILFGGGVWTSSVECGNSSGAVMLDSCDEDGDLTSAGDLVRGATPEKLERDRKWPNPRCGVLGPELF
jgi:hypothetical protein